MELIELGDHVFHINIVLIFSACYVLFNPVFCVKNTSLLSPGSLCYVIRFLFQLSSELSLQRQSLWQP